MPYPSFNTILNRFDGSIDSALCDAAQHGRAHILKIFFENGIDLNYKSDNLFGFSLLHLSAKTLRCKKALNFLLQNGATLFIDDMQNEFEKTPLMVSCSNGSKSEELAMLLLAFGANPKCKQASTGYTAYDFLLQVDSKGFIPSSGYIEILRLATGKN